MAKGPRVSYRSTAARACLARLVPLAAAGLVGVGCNAGALRRDPVDFDAAESMSIAPTTQRPASVSPSPFPPSSSPACAALRDVGLSDVVRLDGTTLFYADGATGLTAVDVADAAHPRVLSVVPFVGTPLALFVREGIAWVVILDSDARFGKQGPVTVVRAVDVRSPSSPRILGDEVREGSARDAKLVGGFLYLMRGSRERTVVEAFGVAGTRLHAQDKVEIEGVPAQLAASAAGLAAVTNGEDHATVAWLDLSTERPGAIAVRRSVHLLGGVASWTRGEGRVVAADEGQRVRIVTCATTWCTPTDAATLQIIDFASETPMRSMSSRRLTEHGGVPTTRFVDGLLYVAETPASGSELTTLQIVSTEDRPPRVLARHPLRGRISALVPHADSLVALGSVGSAETEMRIIVHDVDVRRPSAPRTRTSVTFGSDWTWSGASDNDNALSFDPASHLVAVPFTAWRDTDKRYVTGAQLVDVRPLDGQSAASLPVEGWVERAIFIDGQLVTLGPNGVSSIDYASIRAAQLGERRLEIRR
jgi:hypothetical protein